MAPMDALMRAQQEHLVGQVMDNEKIAREFGLRSAELQVLHLLVLRPDIRTGRALARSSGLPSSTVADLVRRLVTAGFVERERDASDARVVNLRPTGRVGQIAARYTDSAIARRMARVAEDFGPTELEVVRRYLESLNRLRRDDEHDED